jgi:monoamine oxidase
VEVLVTRWGADEFARGSYSFAAVGSDPEMRDDLAAGVGGRLHLAGEATSREHPSTVHGALLSGRRAAENVLGDLGS